MSLTNQIHAYSVGTDAFYDESEQFIHKRLLKLYKLRAVNRKYKEKETEYSWGTACINRVIKKEKERLEQLLNKRLESTEPRTMNPEVLKDKNVISLFVSSLTRAIGIEHNQLSEDIFVISVYFFQVFHNIVRDGFIYNGEKYIFLTASAGQIRTKKAVFIKESTFNRIKMRMMCGLTVEEINEAGGTNENKFLAYLALGNSATDVWEDFDIDKSIVVDDFETEIQTEVDHIFADYSIKREVTGTVIPHMDGCGIMLDKPTRMVRAPWVKGLLVHFPFDKFIQEKCDGKATVTDIYGQDHDILAEDIRYIFTKSQFKMYKFYQSWEDYKQKFKQYRCEVCYCNMEEQDIPRARINYQMLQTLTDMTDEEIATLIKETVEEIEAIGNDFQTSMKLIGATSYNKNPSYVQEALMIYPELMRDQYSRDILKETKKSLIKQAKSGRLRVNGKYLFLSPDLYAFCEWLFLGEVNPKGLLQDGEVFTTQFSNGDEVACLRSPHLYREWAIRKNVKNEDLNKWFGETKCVYTSCHDLISRILQFDVDGDKSLVIKDKLLTSIAKRNMAGICTLSYDLKKAKVGAISPDNIYHSMTKAYTGGNIGVISNQITKVWNSPNLTKDYEDALKTVKLFTYINNQVIDYAKTLWKVDPPSEVEEMMKRYTKAKPPYFFIYAKDKKKSQVEPPNNSTMNRICQSIPNNRVKFVKMCDNFDYRMLMNLDYGFSISEDNQIVERYNYWNRHQYLFNTEAENAKQEDMYMFQQIRKHILEETNEDINVVVNTLVMYLYTIKTNNMKKTLWASFGDILVENLKKNTEGLGKVCEECGDRFISLQSNHRFCSDECCKKARAKRLKQKRKFCTLVQSEKVANIEDISQNKQNSID